ncbi:acetylxylan esterase [Streptomyces sp. NPDC019224]|uniref:acetylxylan esterase n=1 Tax=Streptomyces sp. NPDC019224 TaxID=3154484 RepID=UPI0033C3EC2C
MALFDLPLDQLRGYRPDPDEPEDFDAFWRRTLDEAAAHPLDAEFAPYDAALAALDTYDVSFAGWGGHRIRAWLNVPAGAEGPLPTVVHYLGYGGGRGLPLDHLVWPAAGWAALIVDTRGQGAVNHHSAGATPDPHGAANPQSPGFMTNGILDPETYYYRRVFTDAVRAVEVARSHPSVDPARIVVNGASQGGGITQAVAALSPHVKAAFVDVPFLTHYRRAVEITNEDPYQEIVRFLATRHGAESQVFRTLSYFDGVSFAARATVPALYSVALMDAICPPSTVFAAYNRWAGPKEIEIYPWNGHEGGTGVHRQAQLRMLRDLR